MMDMQLEIAKADFGDKRLNKRLSLIVERSATHPNLSIPAAMHGRAEMEAAYRFLQMKTSRLTKSKHRTTRILSNVSPSMPFVC